MASAGHDLNIAAGAIASHGNASLSVQNDVNIKVMDNSSQQTQGNNRTDITNITSSMLNNGGDLAINAGRDLHAQSAQLTARPVTRNFYGASRFFAHKMTGF